DGSSRVCANGSGSVSGIGRGVGVGVGVGIVIGIGIVVGIGGGDCTRGDDVDGAGGVDDDG
ncbi:hypothetical protein Tco_0440737, partial [Tanacetum coccineum]